MSNIANQQSNTQQIAWNDAYKLKLHDQLEHFIVWIWLVKWRQLILRVKRNGSVNPRDWHTWSNQLGHCRPIGRWANKLCTTTYLVGFGIPSSVNKETTSIPKTLTKYLWTPNSNDDILDIGLQSNEIFVWLRNRVSLLYDLDWRIEKLWKNNTLLVVTQGLNCWILI